MTSTNTLTQRLEIHNSIATSGSENLHTKPQQHCLQAAMPLLYSDTHQLKRKPVKLPLAEQNTGSFSGFFLGQNSLLLKYPEKNVRSGAFHFHSVSGSAGSVRHTQNWTNSAACVPPLSGNSAAAWGNLPAEEQDAQNSLPPSASLVTLRLWGYSIGCNPSFSLPPNLVPSPPPRNTQHCCKPDWPFLANSTMFHRSLPLQVLNTSSILCNSITISIQKSTKTFWNMNYISAPPHHFVRGNCSRWSLQKQMY